MTGITAQLAGGNQTHAYTFSNPANVYFGDGSNLDGVVSSDTSRVSKAGDTMTGTLTLSATGLGFADGSVQASAGWSLGGNTQTGTRFLGSTDDSPVNFRVGNSTVLRLVHHFATGVDNDFNAETANIVGGRNDNTLGGQNIGVVIAGGGGKQAPQYVSQGVDYAAISGGADNWIYRDSQPTNPNYAVIAGGSGNRITGAHGVVSGGLSNLVQGTFSGVGGGQGNDVRGMYSFIAGGQRNNARGAYSFIAGGRDNFAEADHTFAAGDRATSFHPGAMVLAAGYGLGAFLSENDSEFAVRAVGGVRLVTSVPMVTGGTTGFPEPAAGVFLAPGSSTWSTLSDRAAKKNIVAVDGEAVLSAVARMPVFRWSYNTQADGIRHMGPMAQDFRAAFGLGVGDTTIDTVDADGVSLAAVQALEKRTAKLLDENAVLRDELARMGATQRQMLQRLEEMEKRQRQ